MSLQRLSKLMEHVALSLFLLLCLTRPCLAWLGDALGTPTHPLVPEFVAYLEHCAPFNGDPSSFPGPNGRPVYCDAHNASVLAAKIANEHAALLLHDTVQELFNDAAYAVPPNSSLGLHLSHMMAVLSFSQGELSQVHAMACINFG